jgi:hypothetical protein
VLTNEVAVALRSGRILLENRSLALIVALSKLFVCNAVDHSIRVCNGDSKFVPVITDHKEGVNGCASVRDRISTDSISVHVVTAS